MSNPNSGRPETAPPRPRFRRHWPNGPGLDLQHLGNDYKRFSAHGTRLFELNDAKPREVHEAISAEVPALRRGGESLSASAAITLPSDKVGIAT